MPFSHILRRKNASNFNAILNPNVPRDGPESISSMPAYRSIAYITFPLGVLLTATEIFKLFMLRCKYFCNVDNVLELTLYVSAVVHLRIFLFKAEILSDESIIIPVLCIFLAWTNHLLYLKGLPVYGIYVVMFVKVCFSVIKLLVLFAVIFLAFILMFYLLHIDDAGFTHTEDILIKVIAMMTGEFEFGEWLYKRETNSRNIPRISYREILYITLIFFVLLVAVAFTNLLVSDLTLSF